MSRLLALTFASVAGAATVRSSQQHMEATRDPDMMLESIRALAEQAQQGKIDADVIDEVQELVNQIEQTLMTDFHGIVTAADADVLAKLGALNALIAGLAGDVETGNGVAAAITESIADDLAPCRARETNAHHARETTCGDVCTDVSEPICHPPAGGDWQDDTEPCCVFAPDHNFDDVPVVRRSSEWADLEDYMDCLNTFVADFGTWDTYTSDAEACINASTVWHNVKQTECDPDSNARDLCDATDTEVAMCAKYVSDFDRDLGHHGTSLSGAKALVENTMAQYNTLEKIKCLFAAIRASTEGGGADAVRQACQACEAAAPLCNAADVCNPFDTCPFECANCCVDPPTPPCCGDDHPCDVCTNAFRHEHYGCPADGCAAGADASGTCGLLIEQNGCPSMRCEDCALLGTLPATCTKDARSAFDEFNCGGSAIGNEDFTPPGFDLFR